MQSVRSGGLDVVVQQIGDGPVPTVFVHGFQNRGALWAATMTRLADTIRGVSLDLPGCGDSARPEEADRCLVERYAEDVGAVIDQLGLARPVVVGHSLGGGIALRLVLDRPELARGLVLVAPLSTTGLDFLTSEQIEALARPSFEDALALARAAFFRPPSDEIFDEVVDAMRHASPAHIEGAVRSMAGFTVAAELTALAVPTVLVAGDRDRHVPLRNHLATWAAIRRCGLQVFHQVGHVPFVEEPVGFDAAFTRFVSTLG